MHVLITKPPVKTLDENRELAAISEARDLLCCIEVHKRSRPTLLSLPTLLSFSLPLSFSPSPSFSLSECLNQDLPTVHTRWLLSVRLMTCCAASRSTSGRAPLPLYMYRKI